MPSNPTDFLHRLLPTSHRILLDRLLRVELAQAHGDVLILGAGHDPYDELLPADARVCRTDISTEYEIDVIADAHDLPFEDASYDAVVAVEVFEHLERPHQAAAEVLRVLRPGGRALISVPFMFHVHGDPMDFNRLTKSGLSALFSAFSSVEVKEFGTRLHVISDIITTGSRGAAILRIINHVFALPVFGRSSSDCPSGYWVRLTR